MTAMGRYRTLNKKPAPLTFLSKVGGPLMAVTGQRYQFNIIHLWEILLFTGTTGSKPLFDQNNQQRFCKPAKISPYSPRS